MRKYFAFISTALFALSACAPTTPVFQPSPSATDAQIPAPTQPAVAALNSRVGDSVPALLRERARELNLPEYVLDASALVVPNSNFNETKIQWIYALVAPFPTVADGATFDQLRGAWSGDATLDNAPLLMDGSTRAALSVAWGEPASNSVRIVPMNDLLAQAWSQSAWAIIPFEDLQPQWKTLTIDGQSPIRKDFERASYPLVVDFTLQSSAALEPLTSNYDLSKLTTVIMTGVTALVRATALTMEYKGATYPGEKIRDALREADITHISNEIPFFTGCTFPKPDQVALVFCSDPKYMALFLDVGADVIELTGNHFADRGARGMLETIEIYKRHNLPYFGGGADLQDALKPALFDVNGNKIAFIGCNKPDVDRFPTARDYRPGAAPCDFKYLAAEIAALTAQGYVVISTFQWNESYDSQPNPQQIRDFRAMADAGASVISGSQAHYAQKMEFYGEAFIHYGLGNLFFDQMGDQSWMPRGIRREFIDRYAIYNGRLIGVELLTAMLEDYSRPRWMNEAERAEFLNDYFYYSGWAPPIPTPVPAVTPTLTPMSIPTP
ncbi:MAG: CapA family protein [Anaerolineaceae bacterium]|nr:CapA family protein [Anaerolineaceae bacterium]